MASFGDEPQLLFEASTASWLKFTLSNSQSIIINDASEQALPVYFHQLRNLGHDFLVGVAIRCKNEKIIGVILASSSLPQQRLSAAQVNALQTHAAIISQILQLQTAMFLPKDEPFIERLRLLESVVVNAKDAILIIEAEPIDQLGPRIIYCNPAFLATTGFTSSEVIGQHASDSSMRRNQPRSSGSHSRKSFRLEAHRGGTRQYAPRWQQILG